MQPWRSILSTFGVAQMVMSGEFPLPVPAGVVDEIIGREDPHGYVKLPGAHPPVGSKVRIGDGIFADRFGLLAQVKDEDRVTVLLSLLGRTVRVSIDSHSVVAV
jgi:transcriptional antiterminator RfaH